MAKKKALEKKSWIVTVRREIEQEFYVDAISEAEAEKIVYAGDGECGPEINEFNFTVSNVEENV